MSSSRNMAIVGLSIMVGIMIPIYIRETKDPIKTGIFGSGPLNTFQHFACCIRFREDTRSNLLFLH